MKLFFVSMFVFAVLAFDALAAGPNASDVRRPVGVPQILDTSTTNVTSAAWVQFIASPTYACSAVLVHNPGSQPIKVGVGAAASEVDMGLVLPIGVPTLVPVVTKKGVRISLRSMGSTQSSGIITWSCFQ